MIIVAVVTVVVVAIAIFGIRNNSSRRELDDGISGPEENSCVSRASDPIRKVEMLNAFVTVIALSNTNTNDSVIAVFILDYYTLRSCKE